MVVGGPQTPLSRRAGGPDILCADLVHHIYCIYTYGTTYMTEDTCLILCPFYADAHGCNILKRFLSWFSESLDFYIRKQTDCKKCINLKLLWVSPRKRILHRFFYLKYKFLWGKKTVVNSTESYCNLRPLVNHGLEMYRWSCKHTQKTNVLVIQYVIL